MQDEMIVQRLMQAERSDLAVLLAKRAEQIAHPAATIHGATGHTDDEEIQMVVNEHANRIMVYADMLLQMQVPSSIPLILTFKIVH